jgi:predicted ATPase/tRNA A-37 threonylcarbamoyl transferase component Bud32
MRLEVLNYRYQLEDPIGKGAMGVIYRAYDRLEGRRVALKRVRIEPSLSSPVSSTDRSARREYLTTITHEFAMLSSMRHPNIISVLDYGFDSNQMPYYVMELLQESETVIDRSKQLPFETRLHRLIDLLRALEYLHRRNIVHRDLKPANVLLTAENVVKVLDFGLATVTKRSSEEDAGESLVGTLAYMSPEAFNGGHTDERSDLYAVGIIAYQLFAHKHPFDTENVHRLIFDTLNTRPDLSPVNEIDPSLGVIVGRLLEKQANHRYDSAYEVIRALAEVLGEQVPPESLAVRESFLQAAHLVGRDTELNQLAQALKEAKQGRGGVWFLSGESGIGKSRLLEEIRARALVEGMMVMVGQAVQEGGHPYQLWREPLRRLLITESPVQEVEARVLKPIVADIEALLSRSVEDAPELSGRAELSRLATTIADMVKRQATLAPTLLILEDVHWAQTALEPLQQLLVLAEELSLLVLVSYRDDETPNLANAYQGANVLPLKRLTDAQIATLAQSMIGDAGKRADVVKLLQRETEGNLYFLIETVRTLAEEAGTLHNIGLATLPRSVLAGGVQKLIARRIERIPDEARRLLSLAAVFGREIDLPLMRVLGRMKNDAALEAWLGACADAAILGVQDGVWRFLHDKLRQGMIALLTPEEKRLHHLQLAQALERISTNINQMAGIITEHYAQAGETARLQLYAPIAATQAQRICDYHNVLRYVGMVNNPNASLIKLTGDAYEGLGNYQLAGEAYQRVQEATTATTEDVIAALNGLSVVHWRRNDYATSTRYAEQALELAQAHGDERGEATAQNNLGIIASDTANFAKAQAHYERGLVLRQETGDLQGEGYILNSLGVATYDQAKYLQARDYFMQARDIAEAIGDRHEVAFALHGVSMAQTSLGEHQAAVDSAQEGLNIARELGNRRGIALCSWRLAVAEGFMTGTRDSTAFDEAIQITRSIGDQRLLANILHDKARVLTLIGALDEAQALLQEANGIRKSVSDRVGVLNTTLERAIVARERGDNATSQAFLDEAQAIAESIESPTHLADVALNRGWLALLRDDLQEAQAQFNRAEALLDTSNAVHLRATLHLLRAVWLARKGDYLASARLMGQAERSEVRNRRDIQALVRDVDALIAPNLPPDDYARARRGDS